VSAPPIEVDWSRHPLVVFRRRPGVATTLEGAEELCRLTAELFERRQRVGLILDMRGAALPDAKTRKLIAEFAKDNAHLFERWLAAQADVIDSEMLRHVITAINWIAPPEYPTRAFTSLDEAASWVTDALRAEGLVK
jgi:hypothetical protein